LPGEVRTLVFSEDGARVALAAEPAPYAGSGMAISVAGTTPHSLRAVTRLERTRASFGTQEGVSDMAWSPDGTTLAAYADVVDDGGCTSSWGSGVCRERVLLVDVASGALRQVSARTMEHPRSVSWAP
jgi:hypothetical protein